MKLFERNGAFYMLDIRRVGSRWQAIGGRFDGGRWGYTLWKDSNKRAAQRVFDNLCADACRLYSEISSLPSGIPAPPDVGGWLELREE